MGEVTNISWCDHTFNPWIGCTKISPACDGCYAEAMMDKRYGRVKWGAPGQGAGTRERTSKGNWSKPKTWNRKAMTAGTRPFVFCSSLADVFDNQVPAEWRVDLFRLIRATPNLVWLLLTKRPQLITKLYEEACREDVQWLGEPWPTNAAIGTTVEDQTRADINVPALLLAKQELKPAFAFLSCEPLLGAIDLQYPVSIWPNGPAGCCSGRDCGCMGLPIDPPLIWGIDWLIAGGETDQGSHKARPSHPDWYRALRDQCAVAGVPFHMKQWGEYHPSNEHDPDIHKACEATPEALHVSGEREYRPFEAGRLIWQEPGWAGMCKIGKQHAGRLIDGVEHNARPEV